MAVLTTTETAAYLQARDHFTIVTHRRPDGDTLGTAALLCRGLRQLGKTAHVLHNPEITPKYQFLHHGLTKEVVDTGDTVITVDVASASMLPQGLDPATHIHLRIDHHRTGDSFTDWELVEPSSAACGQIVYGILRELGVALDVPMADALYTAVSTDTGCFRYANTQAQTYETAADCARVSPNLRELNYELFEVTSLARLRIQGWIVENALFLQEGQVCICPIPREVEQRLGVTEDDMENISGFPRTIAGVKIAATLRQESAGRVKLSVRALPDYDASAICATFGGGGHRGAAGASFDLPMEEAVKRVIAAIPQL